MKSRMDKPSTSTTLPTPVTGRFVAICFVAFFGVVIGVNMLMMKVAIDTLPGTEVDSAYRASLAYQSEIRAARDQSQRNWNVETHIERDAGGFVTLSVKARDANDVVLTGYLFSARLERPTDKRSDRVVDLRESEAGLYRGAVPNLSSGVWDLIVEGEQSDRRLFLSKNRILLR